MNKVLFYEKPGCVTNARQKKLLRASGLDLQVHNLLTHTMDAQTLHSYLRHRPVAEWFNPSAPALKRGEIDTENLTEEEALALLMQEPILIRRPLIEISGHRFCGFPESEIEAITGSTTGGTGDALEQCSSETACLSTQP